ncbi:L,D-transpeptidase family protein [Thermodesulfobacteriota bacterium]
MCPIQLIKMYKRSTFAGFISESPLAVLLSIIIILWGSPASANPVKQPIIKQKLVPSIFLEWGKGNPDYTVLVDKSKQNVILYSSDNLFTPEKVYKCSTGENDGPKSKKNDRKTPEGIYFFTNSVEEKYLSPIYGKRALPINYPNIIDKKEGRKGYGIWFHGTNKPLEPRDTNGCIVLDNKDIEELATRVKLFDTPIIISSRIELVPLAELEKEAGELRKIIENWRSAWQDKDIEKYMSFYNRRFTAVGKNWRQWKGYKSRLAEKYNRINVQIDNLRLLENDGVVLATFKQTYRTPSFESHGTKKLYITKNSNQWKIIGESFKGEEKARALTKKVSPFSLKEIEDFIHLWRDTWEKKDLKRYISCYDVNFQSRGMGLNAWEKHRDQLNKKYRSLKVTISNMKIKRISNKSAGVSFTQNYRADGYKDRGIKKMVLIKKGKDWKIKEEKWTSIKRKARP